MRWRGILAMAGVPAAFAGGVPPTVDSFNPTSGPEGTIVTITGTGFTGATAVTFNGTSASFTVDSDVQITATVPVGADDRTDRRDHAGRYGRERNALHRLLSTDTGPDRVVIHAHAG